VRRAFALAAGLFAALSLSACDRIAPDDEAFGRRVRAYLLEHPEVLQEAITRLQSKMAADQEAATLKLLPKYRSAIERDARDFVANPTGAITVTQFYDYRCPHCINVAPKVVALIRDNPDVRVVFKEMPIFGEPSEHGARVALALKDAGGDYLGYYEAAMAGRFTEAGEFDRLAVSKGASAAAVRTAVDAEAIRKHMADTNELFQALNLGGTPAFIVGDRVIPGEQIELVRAEVQRLRAGSPAPYRAPAKPAA
jgi:protein-disulfide isomerase